jgi:chromosome partitioning protein
MPDRHPHGIQLCLQAVIQCDSSGGMIIVIANSKGGVGKSTLAVHLASWLHAQGHRVTLADCDTQQSSSEWIREATPGVTAVRLDNPDIILNELPQLAQDADYVVADGPGSQTETSRALLLRADMAIVPCKASMLEVRALAKATDVLRQAQSIRGGMPDAIIVLSMVGKHYRLTQDMKDAAAALALPLASTAMTLRQIYADAPWQAAVVWDMGARAREAATETEALFREILPEAMRHRSTRRKPVIARESSDLWHDEEMASEAARVMRAGEGT